MRLSIPSLLSPPPLPPAPPSPPSPPPPPPPLPPPSPPPPSSPPHPARLPPQPGAGAAADGPAAALPCSLVAVYSVSRRRLYPIEHSPIPSPARKKLFRTPQASASTPPSRGPTTHTPERMKLCSPRICARCCGARSVKSAIIAEEPVIEAAEPTPQSRRNPTTGTNPCDMKSPVPIEPPAVMSVPQRMSGKRPTVSATRPSGRLMASLARDGAAMSAPMPVAPRPISEASKGSTGIT